MEISSSHRINDNNNREMSKNINKIHKRYEKIDDITQIESLLCNINGL